MRLPIALVLSLACFACADVTQKEIDEAIKKGADFLKAGAAPQGVAASLQTDELVALTLAHAGMKPSEEPLAGMIKRITDGPLTMTYNVAIQAVLLLHLDPRKYRSRIADCGQFLVDSQCSNGQWTYNGKETQTPDKTVASGGGEGTFALKEQGGGTVAGVNLSMGDNSNAQFGILGLWAVQKAGIKVPAGPFERAEKWWKSCMGTDEGWGYGRNQVSYGSMTCAGVAAMAITGMGLGNAQRNAGQVASGVRWLARNFSVEKNPRTSNYLYYYLYSLERAGTIANVKMIGDHDWYKEGARFLVDHQAADGSWTAENAFYDTCFAVLFLKRATLSLLTAVPVDHAGVTPDDPAQEPADPVEKEDGK